MKKLFALLLVLAMLVSLCACTEQKKEEPEAAPETAPAAEEEIPEEAPAEEEPVQEETTPVEEEPVQEEAEEPEAEPETEEEAEEEELPVISGIAGEAGYWYEVLGDSGEYTDLSGNLVQYSYSIPAFNYSSDDASRLNDAIMERCQPLIDEMVEGIENGYSLLTLSISYEGSLCGDIASILITVNTDFGFVDYYVFNLNVATGTEATGAEMIAQAGLSEDEFVAAAQNAASESFKSKYGAMEGDPFYQELYDKTMSADMYNLYMPMFFDGNGKMKIVVPIYSMAGAEYYYELLSVN